TQGKHRFFDDEGNSLRDVRKIPISFSGYSVSLNDGEPHVRIQREMYLRLRAYFQDIACKHSASKLVAEIKALPFEPYKPVRGQCLDLVDAINRARKQAGLSTISRFSVRLKRRIYRPFEPVVACEHTLKTGTG